MLWFGDVFWGGDFGHLEMTGTGSVDRIPNDARDGPSIAEYLATIFSLIVGSHAVIWHM